MVDAADVEGAPGIGLYRRERPRLVPSEISRAKLGRELGEWRQYEAVYRGRGILVLGVQDLWVELLVIRQMANTRITVAAACVGLDYTNYDLEPPSLTFLNPVSRQPEPPPFAPLQVVQGQPRNVVPGKHPDTELPFLCLPGVFEYHTHPEHNDDSWLAEYRREGAGRLASIADFLWKSTLPVFVPAQFVQAAIGSAVEGTVKPAGAATEQGSVVEKEGVPSEEQAAGGQETSDDGA